jgi:cobalt-zinc-cadmium efflux system membrane fusion protein
MSELESADAGLKGAMEQAVFESRQAYRQSEVGVEAARRRLDVSRQHLNTLLGYTESMSAKSAPSDLSSVEIRAPFAGTIEQKLVSTAERTQLGEPLFVLADTSRLWVAADLRERDWSAVRLHEGDPLSVETPAIAGKILPAKIHYVGREVSAETNSVPLIGAIDNTDGLLRPGLFVRVTIPVDASRTVIAVPESAVTRHDGSAFVFVSQGDREFREVPVKPGLQDRDWIEITEGLQAGDAVVTAGTFFLKSELLLEADE